MTDDVVQAVRIRFDGRAPSYDESAMHRGLADAVAAFVDLAHVTSILDVATGTGLVLRALRDRCGPDAPRMIGVDVSPGMLAVARHALPDAELIEADVRSLPIPDASVDLVTCVTGLHLIPDTPVVLDEWARVLRPGGGVVTATFATSDPSRHHQERANAVQAPYPNRHDEFCTPQALEDVMVPSGFSLRRHTYWTGDDETLLIAELTYTRG
ncbi:class I SAM-dependent methyltransferase [Pengzhenrongella sp.]|jgi:ubiquinone/menaquinone biosynthesis C-methylase UbiE|uniref:class I SAM-dependent methyltransferase n=1 Tax=Pengzhenrongella sp. TaxID=2888820 RepID=UPI002F94554C